MSAGCVCAVPGVCGMCYGVYVSGMCVCVSVGYVYAVCVWYVCDVHAV